MVQAADLVGELRKLTAARGFDLWSTSKSRRDPTCATEAEPLRGRSGVGDISFPARASAGWKGRRVWMVEGRLARTLQAQYAGAAAQTLSDLADSLPAQSTADTWKQCVLPSLTTQSKNRAVPLAKLC